MRLLAPFLVALLVFGCQHTHRSPSTIADSVASLPPPNPRLEELLSAYSDDLQNLMKRTGTPGAAVAVVTDSTAVLIKCYGNKTLAPAEPIDEHTVFRLGSVSKCLAGLLTAALVQDSVLAWDDPVVKYLPDFRLRTQEHANQLTIRHVLSHTTGLPYHTYTTLIEDGLDLDTMISKLQDVNNGPVGLEYSYQNVAFSIIAKVIEAATGRTYEQVLNDRLLQPLHMADASTSRDDLLANGNIAWPHLVRKGGWKRTSINDTYYNVVPAGGVNASITDMSKLLLALLGHSPRVIDPQSIQSIFEPEVRAQVKNRRYRMLGKIQKAYYGLGWRIVHYASDTLIFHGGYVNGYRSEIALYPKDRVGICILANGPGEVADSGIPLFMKRYLEHRDSIKMWTPKPMVAGLQAQPKGQP